MGFITLPIPSISLKQEYKSPLNGEDYCSTRSGHDKHSVSESWYVKMLWRLAQVQWFLRLAWDSSSCLCTCGLKVGLLSSFTSFTQAWPFEWKFLIFLFTAIWSVLNEEAGVWWLLASSSPSSLCLRCLIQMRFGYVEPIFSWQSCEAPWPPSLGPSHLQSSLQPEGWSPPSQVTIFFSVAL